MTAIKIIATSRKNESIIDKGLYPTHESAEGASTEIKKSLGTMCKYGILTNYELKLIDIEDMDEFETI